jgi:oxysterol-binding protein-related protein 3/6/7
MWMNTHLKSKFWGKSLEFTSLGYMNIKFKDNDEVFICKRPKTVCQNIIIGSMYLDHNGNARVRNSRTNEICQINMRAMGIFSGKDKRGLLNSIVYNSDSEPVYELFGKWTEALYYKAYGEDDEDAIKIWEFEEVPDDWEKNYKFSQFTLQLNNLHPILEKKLPPTDSRFRSDQRYLENGELKEATEEKRRLEDKQRRTMKRRKEVDIRSSYF